MPRAKRKRCEIPLRMPPDLDAELRAAAALSGLNMTTIVVLALRPYLRNYFNQRDGFVPSESSATPMPDQQAS
jgi:uncharacterized protein (DUF1778 family)